MLKTIIRKELLESILNYRFPLFFLICAVLILVRSTSMIWTTTSAFAITASRSGWRQMSWPPPAFRTFHMGRISTSGAFCLPLPYPFSLQDSKPLLLHSTTSSSRRDRSPGPRLAGDESILSVFGKLDFVFIIQMVASLIVLLFASDMIAGEKEMGTLRAILSNGVPRHTVLLGKLAGGFLTVWIPFVTTFVLGMIFLGLLSFPLDRAEIPVRLASVFIATSLFLLAYYTIGLMVSASSARSRTSLVTILLVWIVLQMVIPRLSDMFASVIHPIRTETVVSMQKSLVVKTIEREKALALGAKYEALFGPVKQSSTPQAEPEAEKKEFDAFQTEWEAGPGIKKRLSSGISKTPTSGKKTTARDRHGDLPSLAQRRVLQASHRSLRHGRDRQGELPAIGPRSPANARRGPL